MSEQDKLLLMEKDAEEFAIQLMNKYNSLVSFFVKMNDFGNFTMEITVSSKPLEEDIEICE